MTSLRTAAAVLLVALASTVTLALASSADLAGGDALAPTQDDDGQKAPDKKSDAKADFEGDAFTLTTCPVSGEALGSMGEPIALTVEGRQVKLCCKGCVKRMKAEPAKYLEKVDEALVADQLRVYPSKTCIVSDEPLVEDGEDIGENVIVGNRLFRTCCGMCAKKLKKDPARYFAKLDKAVIAAQVKHYPLDTCIVATKSKLGSMGDPDQVVIANRLVQFCCAGCRKKFFADPAAHLAKLDAAWMKLHDEHGKAHEHDKGHGDGGQ